MAASILLFLLNNLQRTMDVTITIDNFDTFKIQMLNWANQFNIFCLLDNHQYTFTSPAFECLLAVGSKNSIAAQAGNAFNLLTQFSKNNSDWLFGHFSYDLKNEVEQLYSNNTDHIGFADLHFFIPISVIKLSLNAVTIYSDDADDILSQILSQPVAIPSASPLSFDICNRISRQQYYKAMLQIKDHIRRGDCYEINFCQEFFSEKAKIDPVQLYYRLSKISPNPFAVLYKVDDKFCIGASPERYLQKQGNKLISQPIKGTSKRDWQNLQKDEENKQFLLSSKKERSENIIVIDLVRNDLSKICKPGSVKAEELCKIYSFPQVHQMVSTISGIIDDNCYWTDAIKATFPMGSMTGAPKKKVMELIEQYECTKRGLFSGAIGYVTPQKDFDFNVVIRSALYNQTQQYLSYMAGSGITHYSDIEKEYEECLLKLSAFKRILQ